MFRLVVTRLAQLIPTFFGITLVAFAFIRLLPGDPVTLLAGERGVTPERHAELMHQLGFDKPAWQQYLGYLAEIGRAHVCTPVTNAHLVCRLLLDKKNNDQVPNR